MKWTDFKLYQRVETQDDYGQLINSWEYLQDIPVVVSQNLYTNVVADAIYRKFAPAAITKFKNFETGETYKIENNEAEWLIESFNTAGRYTQLLLKGVAYED